MCADEEQTHRSVKTGSKGVIWPTHYITTEVNNSMTTHT